MHLLNCKLWTYVIIIWHIVMKGTNWMHKKSLGGYSSKFWFFDNMLGELLGSLSTDTGSCWWYLSNISLRCWYHGRIHNIPSPCRCCAHTQNSMFWNCRYIVACSVIFRHYCLLIHWKKTLCSGLMYLVLALGRC